MATARTVKTTSTQGVTQVANNQQQQTVNMGLCFTLFDRRAENEVSSFLDFPRTVDALLEGKQLEVLWTAKGIIRNRIMPTIIGSAENEEQAFEIVEKLENTWLELSQKAGTDLYGNLRYHQSAQERLQTRQMSRREAFLAMREK